MKINKRTKNEIVKYTFIWTYSLLFGIISGILYTSSVGVIVMINIFLGLTIITNQEQIKKRLLIK